MRDLPIASWLPTRPIPRLPRQAERGTWNRERILGAFTAWNERFGRAPYLYEWAPATGRAMGSLGPEPCVWELEHPNWPSATTVAFHLGDWRTAREAAGLPLPPQPELPFAERVAIAQRLDRTGESTRSIAEHLGVDIKTARQYTRAGTCRSCGGPRLATDRSKTEFCRVCSLRSIAKARWSREELIEAARAWAEETGRSPRAADWTPSNPKWESERPRWPSASAHRAHFEGWNDLLAAAELVTAKRATWSRAAIVEAVRSWADLHGRPPHRSEWRKAGPSHPSTSCVRRRFGSWEAAVVEAGMPPSKAWARA